MDPLSRRQELNDRVNKVLALIRKEELADKINVKSGNPYRAGGRFAPKSGGSTPPPPPPPAPKTAGLLQEGNLDIHNRPVVLNPETGEISTVKSITVTDDNGRAYLLPTVSTDGKLMSNDESISTFRKTGQHLGIFADEKVAEKYAIQLHKDQEKEYAAAGKKVIKDYQASLNKKGAKIAVDGIWGPKTQAASKRYAKTPSSSTKPRGPNKATQVK